MRCSNIEEVVADKASTVGISVSSVPYESAADEIRGVIEQAKVRFAEPDMPLGSSDPVSYANTGQDGWEECLINGFDAFALGGRSTFAFSAPAGNGARYLVGYHANGNDQGHSYHLFFCRLTPGSVDDDLQCYDCDPCGFIHVGSANQGVLRLMQEVKRALVHNR